MRSSSCPAFLDIVLDPFAGSCRDPGQRGGKSLAGRPTGPSTWDSA